jgi:hypothetical protein
VGHYERKGALSASAVKPQAILREPMGASICLHIEIEFALSAFYGAGKSAWLFRLPSGVSVKLGF